MFAVIYRTGGTVNFRWHQVLERYTDEGRALAAKAELERAGYKALVHRAELLDRLGMPETFDA